jgi:hypothetical protein
MQPIDLIRVLAGEQSCASMTLRQHAQYLRDLIPLMGLATRGRLERSASKLEALADHQDEPSHVAIG